MEVPKTLVVTNDFPPRIGGVERFVHSLVRALPPDRVCVLAPRWDGYQAFDASEPYPIARMAGRFGWPTPGMAARVEALARDEGAEVVLFGSPAPLATLGPRLARRGLPYLTLAHGLEYWLSLAPGGHAGLRHATSRASSVLVCSRFVGRVVRTAVPERVPVVVFPPGVDAGRFHPGVSGDEARGRVGLGGRPVVVCVSRLVPRKGQHVLIRAMRAVRASVPDAALLIVGEGPSRRRLERLAAEAPAGSVVLAGAVSEEELPGWYAAGDVFAMPCRDRFGGLEVEGWGIVFVEAAACGRPVVAGRSGGAPEAVVDGETGFVVDGSDIPTVAAAIVRLLEAPSLAESMGRAGRERVERGLTHERAGEQLARWLRRAAFDHPA